MTARAPGKTVLIPLVLVMALVVMYLALHAGAVSFSGNHGRDTAPVAAPASTQGGATNANQASSGSAAEAPSTGAGHSSGTATSGGPEDAGPDVVKQGSGGGVCSPKICRP